MSVQEHTLFVAGLDAHIAAFNHPSFSGEANRSPASPRFYGMHAIEDSTSKMMGSPVSDLIKARTLRRTRPPPLFMQPLPTIPTVSSPFFPALVHSPEVTQPELSWGTDITSPSYPSFLASSSNASVSQQLNVWSPTSDLPTADILAAYDEYASPTPAEPEHPNHPYVPWTPAFRSRYVPRREDRSPLSPSTNHQSHSRPVSRSGAAAPEPPASPEVPRCGSHIAGGWCRFANRLRREVGTSKQKLRSKASRKVLRKRRTDAVSAFTMAEALRQSAHVLTLGTSGPTAPSDLPPLPSLQLDTSPIAPSFASAGTAALADWLEARRLSASLALDDASATMALDEYERRGSWIYSLHEHGKSGSDLHVADADENARRQDAVRAGWVCGFVGCDMHPRPEWTQSTISLGLEANGTVMHGIAH